MGAVYRSENQIPADFSLLQVIWLSAGLYLHYTQGASKSSLSGAAAVTGVMLSIIKKEN